MSSDEINKQIEVLREQMISVGMTKGLTSLETIRLSEKLDNLLNKKMGISIMA